MSPDSRRGFVFFMLAELKRQTGSFRAGRLLDARDDDRARETEREARAARGGDARGDVYGGDARSGRLRVREVGSVGRLRHGEVLRHRGKVVREVRHDDARRGSAARARSDRSADAERDRDLRHVGAVQVFGRDVVSRIVGVVLLQGHAFREGRVDEVFAVHDAVDPLNALGVARRFAAFARARRGGADVDRAAVGDRDRRIRDVCVHDVVDARGNDGARKGRVVGSACADLSAHGGVHLREGGERRDVDRLRVRKVGVGKRRRHVVRNVGDRHRGSGRAGERGLARSDADGGAARHLRFARPGGLVVDEFVRAFIDEARD